MNVNDFRQQLRGWCVCMLNHFQLFGGPMDCSLPGSSVHGIFQARIKEWAATSSSRESSLPRDRTWVCCVSWIGRQILYHWARPRHSPLEGLLAALVHLKAAAVEGGVQEGHTVHRRAPGHVEDPCAEQAASGQAPAPYYPPLRHPRTAREPGAPVPGPGLSPEPTRPALTGHTGVHQRHTGPRAERPEHDLGEVTLPLGSHGGCRRTGGLRARTLQAPLPPLCASGCICWPTPFLFWGARGTDAVLLMLVGSERPPWPD